VSTSTSFEALDWDAGAYDRLSDPQLAWGLEVLDRLPLRGDEAVLDAGCGSGRVTQALLERLPGGRVVAVDASPSMVERAREALGPRASVVLCDLLDLTLDEPVDAVFSNAVFHWIGDHPRLFRRLHDALRPGGRLAAQCGGRGNVASLRGAMAAVAGERPFEPFLAGYNEPWRFPSPADAIADLQTAGLVEIECWLEHKPTVLEDPKGFWRASSPNSRLEWLPPDLREAFVERVLARLGDSPTLDYVRLNIAARAG
jgi:trans-aconitate 2-methyltransferase